MTVAAPTVLTARRTRRSTGGGTLRFVPTFVQAGRGPHLSDLVFASDELTDPFHSDIRRTADGVGISDVGGRRRFAINVRWNVEGFGYLFLAADNAGELYELPAQGATRSLNLGFEIARSRVARNDRRAAALSRDGWRPSREAAALHDLSSGLLGDATRHADPVQRTSLSQGALLYALRAGELVEVEWARWAIARRPVRQGFRLGCDARAYFQMDADVFLDRFVEAFNFATVNHYLIGAHQDFEPARGDTRFNLRDAVVDDLRRRGVEVEGRPLVWFHHWVTPDWMRQLSYDDLRSYVERHVRKVVSHYGDRLAVWEIANEMHDWANELRLTPDQLVEVTRLACEVARDTNPRVVRLINNCCPFGEYVQQRKWTELDATHPQRTPFQFMKDLHAAGIPFDVSGVQMYFPTRDLADSIALIDRFAAFGKPIHVTETGTTSGPSTRSVKLDTVRLPTDPYAWRRPWDEELQADWMEEFYTIAYSRPQIEAISWYDFVDPHSYIPNGGLLRSPEGDRKPVFDRLVALSKRWQTAPGGAAAP